MGRTTARGYGWRHQKIRARLKPTVDAGLAIRARYRLAIDPGEPWDLGHSPDRARYSRPPASALQSCDVLGSTEADAVRIELEASPRRLRSRCARAAIRERLR
jgi:hypothetical protein